MATRSVFIGQCPLQNWLHVPFDPQNIGSCLDLPYKKCSVHEVYVQGVLENIPPEQLIQAITEWRRVLELGGRLVIIFPDVIKAAFLYKRNVITFEDLQLAVLGYRSALAMEKIENLLIMRFSNVYETHMLKELKSKKLWETILIAEKTQAN